VRTRARLLLELGRIEHDLHDYGAAEDHLSGALASSELDVRAEAARWLARTLMSSGRPDEALARFDEEIEALAGHAPEIALGLESELLLAAVWSPGQHSEMGAWLDRFERRAAGLPRFQAVAGFHRALRRMLEGATAAEVGDRTEAALATGAIDPLDPSFGWAMRMLPGRGSHGGPPALRPPQGSRHRAHPAPRTGCAGICSSSAPSSRARSNAARLSSRGSSTGSTGACAACPLALGCGLRASCLLRSTTAPPRRPPSNDAF
jgi:tetratricopeptide (TPR) repeat protein